MLIDSHAHLDMKDFDRDRPQVLERARQGGVTHIITIGIDYASSLKGLELAAGHEFIFASVGCHPHNAGRLDLKELEAIGALASRKKVVAWGEIGLDFYRPYAPQERQKELFERQLDMASSLNLPVIVHDREAHETVFEILKKRRGANLKGIIHCFSGNYDLAMAFIDLGFYLSIPGVVTYKNAGQIREVAARIPLEAMLIETDAPFLAPVPMRGKRNEPLFVRHTATKIAQLRKMDLQEIARKTGENARRLFGLPGVQGEGGHL